MAGVGVEYQLGLQAEGLARRARRDEALRQRERPLGRVSREEQVRIISQRREPTR